jgi:hypothetical protein
VKASAGTWPPAEATSPHLEQMVEMMTQSVILFGASCLVPC